MQELILIRGLPGSGKTTFAKKVASAFCGYHVEADQYFERNGQYEFSPWLLPKAHASCLERTRMLLDLGHLVVVSNTFTTEGEMKPYLDLALEFDCRVTVMIAENRHGNESVHEVPEVTMNKMANRFSVKLR